MAWFYLLTGIICFGYITLIFSYLFAWKKTPDFHKGLSPPLTKISVILPVRNEEKNISVILSCLVKQKYPNDKFEIIIVDDFSTDTTSDIIKQTTYSNLKYIHLKNGEGKKKAITEGVLYSTGTLIVTTDADCIMNDNWLSAIAAFYEEKKPKMIIAPVLLTDTKKVSFVEHMQSQEMMVLTASAGASLYYNLPLLCSGANLAYEKEAFISVKGFEGNDKVSSGDDVFLMQKMHSTFNKEIKYLKSKDAVVYTTPEKYMQDALRQRKRWASKFCSYGFNHITLTAILIFLTNFLIFITGIFTVINIQYTPLLIACFSAKWIADSMFFYSASLFFGKKIHPFIFLGSSIVYPVYVSLVGLVSPFIGYSWKGRKSGISQR